MVDKEVKDWVDRIKIGEEVDLDHHPLIIWLKGNGRDDRWKKGKQRRRTMRRRVQYEKGKEEFRKKVKIEEMKGKETATGDKSNDKKDKDSSGEGREEQNELVR